MKKKIERNYQHQEKMCEYTIGITDIKNNFLLINLTMQTKMDTR